MATIEKTGPSTWRISKYYQGRRYRMNVDQKPTKANADRLIWTLIESEPDDCVGITYETAAEKYINSKNKILSPATLRGYDSMMRNTPPDFKRKAISVLTAQDVQLCINDYSSGHSAKSMRNFSAFISVVIHSVRPNLNLSTISLPQKVKQSFYVPEDDDIKRILDYAKGSRYEVPLWLAVFGLRRSEICALLTKDLNKNNIVTVNKAKVRDRDGNFVIKTTKTTDSTRDVIITPYVADLIRQLPEGEVYPYSPNQINAYLHRVQEKLEIEPFSLHKIRHYFASTAREIMGDAYVEKLGGWRAGSDIMKKVYDYTKKKQERESQSAFAEKLKTMF